jgi:hypothetical protein
LAYCPHDRRGWVVSSCEKNKFDANIAADIGPRCRTTDFESPRRARRGLINFLHAGAARGASRQLSETPAPRAALGNPFLRTSRRARREPEASPCGKQALGSARFLK